jgi:hypothetical protein
LAVVSVRVADVERWNVKDKGVLKYTRDSPPAYNIDVVAATSAPRGIRNVRKA